MRKYKSGRRAQSRVAFAAVVLVFLAAVLVVLYGFGEVAGLRTALAVGLVALLLSAPLALYLLRARRLNEEILPRHALRDPVTGLPNRASFMERAEHALAGADGGAKGSIAVLYANLDGFEEINCSLGHEAGDRLLAVVGVRLEEAVGRGGAGGTVARPATSLSS